MVSITQTTRNLVIGRICTHCQTLRLLSNVCDASTFAVRALPRLAVNHAAHSLTQMQEKNMKGNMQRHDDNREGWMLNYKLPATGDEDDDDGGGASLCHSNLNCHCVYVGIIPLLLLFSSAPLWRMLQDTSRNGYRLPSCSSLTNLHFSSLCFSSH